MSQQINLRPVAGRQDASGLWLIAGLVVYLGVLGLFVALQSSRVSTLEAGLIGFQDEERMLQARIDRVARGGDAADQIAALDRELAALRSRLSTNETLLKKAEDGSLGLRGGHSRRLRVLASISEPGVWLSSIDIDGTGLDIGLTGNALGYRELMRYTAQANRVMQPLGVVFDSANMSGASPSGTVGSGVTPSPALTFTLK